MEENDMGLSAADLAWINRLPNDASRLDYGDVQRLQGMRALAVRQRAEPSEVKLLDSLLTFADEIIAAHHEPQRVAARARVIDEALSVAARSGLRQVEAGAARLAFKKTRRAAQEQVDAMRREAMSDAERRERMQAIWREAEREEDRQRRDVAHSGQKALDARVKALRDERKTLKV